MKDKVKEVIMYQAIDNTLHSSKDIAEKRNVILRVKNKLKILIEKDQEISNMLDNELFDVILEVIGKYRNEIKIILNEVL